MEAASLSGPWLSLLLAAPLAGTLALGRRQAGEGARGRALAAAGIAFAASLVVFVEHLGAGRGVSTDPLDPLLGLGAAPLFEVDELSAWLLPFGALLFGAALLVAPRRALAGGFAARLLVAESLVLATFACRRPAGIALLWALSIAPLVGELRERADPVAASVFSRHMALAVLLLLGGVLALELAPAEATGARALALLAVLAAVAVRKGIFPAHAWVAELFAGGPLGRWCSSARRSSAPTRWS